MLQAWTNHPTGLTGRTNIFRWMARGTKGPELVVHVAYQFQKIKPTASKQKSLLVAKEMLNAIQSGTFTIGDRLPAERTLAKLMGISRSAVREALSALHAVGVVESFAGDGNYVCSNLRPKDIQHALGILEAEDELSDWLEAREAVESAVAQIALHRAEEGDLAELESILSEMQSATERFDMDVYLEADVRFHRALFQAAHNDTLVRTANVLLSLMQRQLWQTLKKNYYTQQRLLASSYRRHKRIIEALENRDVEELKSAMTAHFKYLSEELEEL